MRYQAFMPYLCSNVLIRGSSCIFGVLEATSTAGSSTLQGKVAFVSTG